MDDEAEFARRLAREAEVWRREGIVTDEQARAIAARYAAGDGAALRAAGGRRLFAHALGLIGAVLVGIGVIVFVAANWESIPGAARLAGVFVATAAAYLTGFRLRYGGKDGGGVGAFPGTGNALLFLGALLFGAGVFLVAQGFHVNANAPSLLVLWAAGVLPMAYLLRAPAFAMLAALSLTVAVGWEAAFWLGGAATGSVSPFLTVFLLFGALLFGVGRLHDADDSRLRPLHAPYDQLGLFLVFAGLLPLTFPAYDPAAGSGLWAGGAFAAAALLRVGVLAGAALLTAAALAARSLRRRRRRRGGVAAAGDGLGEAAAIACVVAGAYAVLASSGVGWSPAHALAANLVLLVLLLGAIGAGYRRGYAAWINLAAVFFGVLVLCRYFDLFWNLMPRALFFIGAGVLLIVGGMWMERTRRRVVDAAASAARDSDNGGTGDGEGEAQP